MWPKFACVCAAPLTWDWQQQKTVVTGADQSWGIDSTSQSDGPLVFHWEWRETAYNVVSGSQKQCCAVQPLFECQNKISLGTKTVETFTNGTTQLKQNMKDMEMNTRVQKWHQVWQAAVSV